ncbi:MAG: hypothetical protein E5Y32_33125 [Mesorhizobium sp.]|nr:MAG: hypothetical protein E5Y32_33125 [Mesorhizobium sp.]
MKPEDATYPPLDVAKPVAPGVWIVDSGPLSVMGIPVPVRMTVIQLGNGGLPLHSPTRFAFELRRQLEQIGLILHLVAPNRAHWTFLKEWQSHVQGLPTWAAPGTGPPRWRQDRSRSWPQRRRKPGRKISIRFSFREPVRSPKSRSAEGDWQ